RRTPAAARASGSLVASHAAAAPVPRGADLLARPASRFRIVFRLTGPGRPHGRRRRIALPAADPVAPRLALPVLHPARPDAPGAFSIDPEDDAGAVYAKAGPIAAELVDEGLALDTSSFRPQPSEGLTCAEKITPADRELDLSLPPEELERRIRALSPHIGAR